MTKGTKDPDKTNVMRILDSRKIHYNIYTYDPNPALTGAEIAGILKEPADRVFKTLVTQGRTNRFYVFIVPVKAELDLKKAAKAVGEKSIDMIHQKDLLPLTGYVHGGCSPIGMKKAFPTLIHETALKMERIFISAGRVGAQIEISTEDLLHTVSAGYADLISQSV